jgi:hypothetical protein
MQSLEAQTRSVDFVETGVASQKDFIVVECCARVATIYCNISLDVSLKGLGAKTN